MKEISNIALLTMVMVGIVSCSKDDDKPHLSVEAAEGTTFLVRGGSIDVSITSDTPWRIDRTAGEASDWLSFNVNQGKESRHVKVYAKVNTTVNGREATLRFVCMSDESVWQDMTFYQEGEEPSLKVSPESVSLVYDGDSVSVKVECNTSWTATVASNWLTLSKESGEGNATLNVKASVNTSADARQCTISFSMGEGLPKRQVEVKQEGKPEPQLTVTPQSVVFLPYAGSREIKVESNTSWTATTDCDWLHLSAQGGKKNSTLTLNVSENTGNEDRRGIVIVSADGLPQQQVEVTQEGMAKLLYREPMVTWGATTDEVAAYMNGYSIFQETDDDMSYYGKHKESLIVYMFDAGRLWNSVVALYATDATAEALGAQLQMVGYRSGGKSMNDIPLYFSKDDKTVTFIDNVSNKQAYYVRYYDYSQPFLAPYMMWNVLMDNVKTAMSKNGYKQGQQGTGSDGYYISYYGKRLEEMSVYHFSKSGLFQEVDVFLDPAIVPYSKVCSYLTSSLSFTKSQIFTSNYGEIYETKDGKTVALVMHPYYSTTNTVQVAFMSMATAITLADGSSRNATRGGMYGEILPSQLKGMPNGLLEQLGKCGPDVRSMTDGILR